MSVLVTGADGFAGQHLLRYLLHMGMEVIAATRDLAPSFPYLSPQERAQLQIYDGFELREKETIYALIEQLRPQTVYHLAAQSHLPSAERTPQLTYEINTIGTLTLADALWQVHKEKVYQPTLLVASSAQVYGMAETVALPLKETAMVKPNNHYAASKAAQEIAALSYFYAHQLPVIVTRAFNHIGPAQSIDFVVPSFARQIAEAALGLRAPIIKVGNLQTSRDFTDVRDVVRAYYLLAKEGKAGEIYNICSGKAIAIATILSHLISFTDITIEIEVDSTRLRVTDIPILFGDSSKLYRATGWQPTQTLAESLYEVYQEQFVRVKESLG